MVREARPPDYIQKADRTPEEVRGKRGNFTFRFNHAVPSTGMMLDKTCNPAPLPGRNPLYILFRWSRYAHHRLHSWYPFGIVVVAVTPFATLERVPGIQVPTRAAPICLRR